MYAVSNEYREAIAKRVVTDRIGGTITLADGTVLTISDRTLVKNSLKISHELCGDYRIGTFQLGCLQIAIFDDNALLRDFTDARICPVYEILTEAGRESVPMGIYLADGTSTRRRRNTVSLVAYDRGILFDRVLSDSMRARLEPAEGLISAACEDCGVVFGGMASGLPNLSVKISAASAQLRTYRDLIAWCAALLCAYAVIDRTGALRLISAKYGVNEQDSSEIRTDKLLTEAERDSVYVTDTRAYIRTLHVYRGGTLKTYLSDAVQEDEQAAPAVYTLGENPILPETLSEEERDRIHKDWLEYIDGFKQRGINAEIYGDPALDVGDVIRCSGGDIDQRRSVVGLVTKQEWRYRNFHTIVCAAPQLVGTLREGSATVESQTEKRLSAVSPLPYTAGQGITIKDREIGLKVAGTGRYWDGNWKNLIGGIFIDSSTARSGESLSVDHMGTLQLKPATKSSLGGVKAGRNVSIERDGTLSFDNSSSTRVTHCIVAQGKAVYKFGYLRAGSLGGQNPSFDFEWLPTYVSGSRQINVNLYRGAAEFKKIYAEYESDDRSASYCTIYAEDAYGGKTALSNPQNPFYSRQDWNYDRLVFVADAVIPPGMDPWGKDCPYGCASVLLYFLYLYAGNNPTVRIDAACSAPLRIPFSSEAEYKNAQAAM